VSVPGTRTLKSFAEEELGDDYPMDPSDVEHKEEN